MSISIKHLVLAGLLALALNSACAEPSRPVTSLDETLGQTGRKYAERLQAATAELAAARARVVEDKAPLLDEWQSLEAKAAALEMQISRLKSARDKDQERRRQLAKEGDSLRRNLGYLNTLASDNLKIIEGSVRPGEPQVISERLAELQRRLETAGTSPDSHAATAIAVAGIDRIGECLGGSLTPGKSLVGSDTRVVPGHYAHAGPETLFLAADGSAVGTVRTREGSPFPVTHRIEGWDAATAAPLFQGASGFFMADPTGGKALRLSETRGTLLEHIHHGGIVAYSILCVGLVSLVLILLKVRDLRALKVSSTASVDHVAGLLATGRLQEARKAAEALSCCSREIALACLDGMHLNKEALEDNLDALLTRQRLEGERRLPLLAVIATASPLMGLLGTVMGMVKTFALITVFGTGNAGKLSSGISEVLVTTELGLAVAIPSLVAHGYLSHRIHKQLALLERQAFELQLAAEAARTASTKARQAAGSLS